MNCQLKDNDGFHSDRISIPTWITLTLQLQSLAEVSGALGVAVRYPIKIPKINVYSTRPAKRLRVVNNAALSPLAIRALFPVGAGAPPDPVPAVVLVGFSDVERPLGATVPPMAVALNAA